MKNQILSKAEQKFLNSMMSLKRKKIDIIDNLLSEQLELSLEKIHKIAESLNKKGKIEICAMNSIATENTWFEYWRT